MWAFCVYRCNRSGAVRGFAGRHAVAGLAAGSFVHSAGRQPLFRVTRLFPATSSQPAACSPRKSHRYKHNWFHLTKKARLCHKINFFCFLLLEKQSWSVYFQICEVLVWVNISGVNKQWLSSASRPYDLLRTERSTNILLACSGSCRHPSAPRLPTLRRMFSKMGTCSHYLSHCFILLRANEIHWFGVHKMILVGVFI